MPFHLNKSPQSAGIPQLLEVAVSATEVQSACAKEALKDGQLMRGEDWPEGSAPPGSGVQKRLRLSASVVSLGEKNMKEIAKRHPLQRWHGDKSTNIYYIYNIYIYIYKIWGFCFSQGKYGPWRDWGTWRILNQHRFPQRSCCLKRLSNSFDQYASPLLPFARLQSNMSDTFVNRVL